MADGMFASAAVDMKETVSKTVKKSSAQMLRLPPPPAAPWSPRQQPTALTGVIREIDENEVVELIPGDTHQKTTTLRTSSKGPELYRRAITPYASTPSLTIDHDRNHTTISTSIPPSTTIHSTSHIHESSTKPTETESSTVSTVSGIPT
ncbi:hypothetical protein OSTOST_23684, partial [Ostertagia ostertagi]